MNQGLNNKISNSQYDILINDYSKNSSAKEKSITSGKIVSIENDIVTIDVGLKTDISTSSIINKIKNLNAN